jgi:DNA-binding transcriptional LysR family regulator
VNIRWDDARVFLAIARTGSLSAAAAKLGAGVATVSRQIERLEVGLGRTLFSRHQTGYCLTEDGAALLARAEALEAAGEAFVEGTPAQPAIAGRVTLATSDFLANEIIIPALPGFLAAHPELSLEVLTDIHAVNLHRRDADLAVRLVKPTRGNLKIRRLGALGLGLYASRSHVALVPRSESGEARPERLITWSDRHSHLAAAQWTEAYLAGRTPTLTTTSLGAQVAAVAAGVGSAVLPHFIAWRHGFTCLRADLGIDRDIWFAVHADLAASTKIRLMSGFLADAIQGQRLRLETAPGAGEPAS